LNSCRLYLGFGGNLLYSSRNKSAYVKNTSRLNSWYVTGLIDAEGCFGISISKSTTRSLGYALNLSFEIALQASDKDLLLKLKDYFGVGGIYNHTSDMYRFNTPTLITPLNLNPNWVTGFSDAEGCFTISFQKYSRGEIGWTVRAGFVIGLHKKDRLLLEQIKSYFDQRGQGSVGEIYVLHKNAYQYRVSSVKDLEVIIEHFENYPLLTQKK